MWTFFFPHPMVQTILFCENVTFVLIFLWIYSTEKHLPGRPKKRVMWTSIYTHPHAHVWCIYLPKPLLIAIENDVFKRPPTFLSRRIAVVDNAMIIFILILIGWRCVQQLSCACPWCKPRTRSTWITMPTRFRFMIPPPAESPTPCQSPSTWPLLPPTA